MAVATSYRERIQEEVVRKAVNALLKWRIKLRSQSSDGDVDDVECDDFVYLSITLKKTPPRDLTRAPHRIPLRHSLLSRDCSGLNLCLIVDGKRITVEYANRMLKLQGIDSVKQVLKLSKLRSDYASFDAKKRLYESFDVFLAARRVVPLLPKVLGKVFYKKKRKIPVPVELEPDENNWKDEIERACKSSLLCLSGGNCSAVRVGRWGVTDSTEIVENVFEVLDEVLKIVPKKWKGIKCLHLKFSDSLALPIYDGLQANQPCNSEIRGGVSGLVGVKRKR